MIALGPLGTFCTGGQIGNQGLHWFIFQYLKTYFMKLLYVKCVETVRSPRYSVLSLKTHFRQQQTDRYIMQQIALFYETRNRMYCTKYWINKEGSTNDENISLFVKLFGLRCLWIFSRAFSVALDSPCPCVHAAKQKSPNVILTTTEWANCPSAHSASLVHVGLHKYVLFRIDHLLWILHYGL